MARQDAENHDLIHEPEVLMEGAPAAHHTPNWPELQHSAATLPDQINAMHRKYQNIEEDRQQLQLQLQQSQLQQQETQRQLQEKQRQLLEAQRQLNQALQSNALE